MKETQLWQLAEQVMTPDQHLAFWLYYHEDMPTTDIAAALGISRQATDQRIKAGLKRLTDHVEQRTEAA